MVTLKVRKNALQIRRAFEVVPHFQIIKLTEEQAFAFDDTKVLTFEHALKLYGAQNRLQEGEQYDGYILVCHNHLEVNYLNGSLSIERDAKQVYWAPSVYKDAFAKRSLLRVSPPKGCDGSGVLNYVWTFYGCNFSLALRKKIVDALLADRPVTLDEDENSELKRYLGKYYQQFFTVVS